jgi:hypothetical protein
MRTYLAVFFVAMTFCARGQELIMEAPRKEPPTTTVDGETFTITSTDQRSGTIIAYKVDNIGHKLFALLELTTKKKLTPFVFDRIAGFYDNNLALVELGMKDGIINNKGQVVIPCIYNRLHAFKVNDTAYYIVSKNARYGVVNEKNETIIPVVYEKIKREINDKTQLVLTKNGKMGVMDFASRKMIVPVQYDRVDVQSSNLILIDHNEHYSYLNVVTGKMLPGWYTRLQTLGDNMLVEQKGQWGVIDWADKKIIPLEYDKLDIEYSATQRVLIASRSGKYGILSVEGKTLLPLQYEQLRKVGRNVIMVSADNKKGLFNLSGEAVLPVGYDELRTATDSTFIVRKDNKFGVVNQAGKFILPVEYDALFDLYISGKVGWLQLAYKNGKQGIVNAINGKVEVNCVYDDLIGRYTNSEARYQSFDFSLIVVKNGKFGFINIRDEKVRVPFEYDELQYIDQRNLLAKKGNKFGVISFDNIEVLPFEYRFITCNNSTIVAYKNGYEKFKVTVDKIEKIK